MVIVFRISDKSKYHIAVKKSFVRSIITAALDKSTGPYRCKGNQKCDEALLYTLTLYRIDMRVIRPEMFQKMVKIVLVGKLFERNRRVQIKFCRQRGTIILKGIGSDTVIKEGLLNVRYLSSGLFPSPHYDPRHLCTSYSSSQCESRDFPAFAFSAFVDTT